MPMNFLQLAHVLNIASKNATPVVFSTRKSFRGFTGFDMTPAQAAALSRGFVPPEFIRAKAIILPLASTGEVPFCIGFAEQPDTFVNLTNDATKPVWASFPVTNKKKSVRVIDHALIEFDEDDRPRFRCVLGTELLFGAELFGTEL